MSSYHTSFTYLGFNSYENFNLIISHFDNYDNGEIDSFLSVDPIYHDSYDGTKRTLYGTKYNSVYTLDITVLNSNLKEFSPTQVRAINRWLTGHQSYSWMDLYVGDDVKCRLHCYVKDVRPYKMDARIIGFVINVESSSPWAYSPINTKSITVLGHKELIIKCDTDDVDKYVPMNINFTKKQNQVVCLDPDTNALEFRDGEFSCNNDVINFNSITTSYNASNKILSLNGTFAASSNFIISNDSINDEISISNISNNETVTMLDNMIIQSNKPSRIFGDDFNYNWPKLKYGINFISVDGDGDLELSYITPRKIGDCIYDYTILSGINLSDPSGDYDDDDNNNNNNNNHSFNNGIFVRGNGSFECNVDDDGTLRFTHTHTASNFIQN